MSADTYLKIKKMSPLFVVANLDRSVEFYTQVLGFAVDFTYEDFYVGIINNGHSIHLKLGEEEGRLNKENSDDIDITFVVDNIEHLYQQLLTKLVKIVQPLRQMPYGKEFYVADPDGYILAFLQ